MLQSISQKIRKITLAKRLVIIGIILVFVLVGQYEWEDSVLNYGVLSLSQYKGSAVDVSVIDSGINQEGIGRSGLVKEINLLKDSSKNIMHGTEVYAIMLGKNGTGASLIRTTWSVRIVKANGKTSLQLLRQALLESIDNDVDIINISLSTPKNDDKLKALIDMALKQDILVIASYDNNDKLKSYPAEYPGVIGVKQTDVAKISVKHDEILVPEHNALQAEINNEDKIFTGNSYATAFITGCMIKIIDYLKQNEKHVTKDIVIEELRKRIN